MSSGNPFTKKEIRESSLRQPTVAYSAAPAHPGMSGRTITVRMSHTKKQLHGWWPGRRECTSERLLINPYVGCAVDCLFCYTKSYPGAFFDFRRRGIITVWPDFDQTVARQLDSLSVAACGYLSPVTDPFQEVNRRYRLSEKIIAAFIERNIPLEFITKEVIPQKAIDLVARHPHSFGQVTILTLDEGARRSLMSGGATTDDLCALYLDNLHEQFGDAVEVSDDFGWEWIAIPHIYATPFYCYAYSFGHLLVLALYQQYRNEGVSFVPRFLKILAYGGSQSPEHIISEAGFDMASPGFWQGGFDVLRGMLDELEAL